MLTPTDLEALPASRELDALVAEKVMGCSHLATLDANVFCRCSPAMHNGEDGFLSPYSTSIAAAWEVVEKLGLFDEAHLRRNLWNKISWQIIRETYPEGNILAEADTAALAICRAALRAISQEVSA